MVRMVAWLAVVPRPENSVTPPVLVVIVAVPAVVTPWNSLPPTVTVSKRTVPPLLVVIFALPAELLVNPPEKVIIPPLAAFSVGTFDELLTMPTPLMIVKV